MQKRALIPAFALAAALALGTAPLAYAAEANASHNPVISQAMPVSQTLQDVKVSEGTLPLSTDAPAKTANDFLADVQSAHAEAQSQRALEAANKTLTWDEGLLAAIGTQESTGHSICCPTFACAYGDAIVQGIANDHTYYGCGCCTWPNWGGGNSSFRDLGSAQGVLREAYDQIKAGYPTVVHVAASYGQHWVTLVGYQNVEDPDNLTEANFVCLDPWDGCQYTLSDKFVLYGDNCQHVSELSA